jgi:hypothetical protein
MELRTAVHFFQSSKKVEIKGKMNCFTIRKLNKEGTKH